MRSPLGILAINNPALIDSRDSWARVSYRDQWSAISLNPTALYCGYWHSSRKLKANIGAMYGRETFGSGTLVNEHADIFLARRMVISRRIIVTPGARAGYISKRLDLTKQNYKAYTDPQNGEIYDSVNYGNNLNLGTFDFSAGVSVMVGLKTKLGYALHHLSRPNIHLGGGEAAIDFRHNIFAITEFALSGGTFRANYTKLAFFGNFDQQNNWHSVSGGTMFQLNNYLVGVGWAGDSRTNIGLRHSILGIARIAFGSFRLRYLNEINLSGYSLISHEIGVDVKLTRRRRRGYSWL